MIGLDAIRIGKQADSKLSLSKLKQILEENLKRVASSTKFDIWNDGEKVTVLFKKKPISLQTVNQIMHALQTKRIKIKKFSWEEYDKGPIKRGRMDITVS